MVIHLLNEKVKKDPNGIGLANSSSQFTEHVFKLFKSFCKRHCNHQSLWLKYIANLHDGMIFGAFIHNLIDLNALNNKNENIQNLVFETDETKQMDQVLLQDSDEKFRYFVYYCNQIKLPENPDEPLQLPQQLQILNDENEENLHENEEFNSRERRKIYKRNDNTFPTYMESDYDSDFDGDIDAENFPTHIQEPRSGSDVDIDTQTQVWNPNDAAPWQRMKELMRNMS